MSPVKLVLTLLCRDSEDVVDAHLAFHLNAGVDFVIATDHRSADGTTAVLERYAREGHLHLIREESEEFRQSEWVTRMARLAATDFGADWIVNSDADEFWWPRGKGLKEVLTAIPVRYGVVNGLWRTFPPRPDDGRFFAERMVYRLAPTAPVNDPTTPWRPNTKVIHRADPRITVGVGNHTVRGTSLQPLRGWFPFEILHFPWRSYEQSDSKASAYGGRGFDHGTRLASDARDAGHLREHFESLVVDDEALERGLESGYVVEDTRVRDVLRLLAGTDAVAADLEHRRFAGPASGTEIPFAQPSVVEDAEYAVDVAVYTEAELVRAQRHLDDVERRLSTLEHGLLSRASRAVRRIVRRGGGS